MRLLSWFPQTHMYIDRSSSGKNTQELFSAATKTAEACLPPVIGDFTAIYEQYHAAILRFCNGKCRDSDLGEDMTQETFLRFWTCLQRKDSILLSRPFLYRIAHNLFIDHIRRKKEVSLDVLLEAGFEPSVDPWHHTYSRLDAARPIRKLSKMPKTHRLALHRRFILGLTPAEIGVMTGESPNTVSVRIFRGLSHLRKQLEHNPVVVAPMERATAIS